MKYHTIKSERYNLRARGQYASYPIYSHLTGEREYTLECYSINLDINLKRLNNGDDAGFFKYEVTKWQYMNFN